MVNSEWYVCARQVSRPAFRLFCFPYAGSSGSLSVFREWARALPAWIEVLTLELPGRGRRYGQPLLSSLTDVSSRLVQVTAPLTDLPYAFAGHSIGALIAFELTRALRSRVARLPRALLVSGKRAPQLPHPQRLHQLPEAQLVEALREYNGTPSEVLQNPELMELFLPILRADFALAETYVHRSEAPFAIPLHAFGGHEDAGVGQDCLRAWGSHTTGTFSCEMFPGDHFFLQGEGRQQLQARVVDLVMQMAAVRTEGVAA